jgi:hypothetical protein
LWREGNEQQQGHNRQFQHTRRVQRIYETVLEKSDVRVLRLNDSVSEL